MASSAQDDPNAIVLSPILAPQIQALNEFWSDDALADAEPIGLEVDAAQTQLLAEAEWQAEGDRVSAAPMRPGPGVADGWDPQPICPPTGSTTERVPDRSVIPYCAVGKLFMTFDGKRYVASAWTIGDVGVFTAGHCVYDNQDGGGWADNVLFVPQYHQGAEPLGRWAATRLASLNGWLAGGPGKFKYDFGAFRVDRPVRPVTGSLGWIANGPLPQRCITGIGYPAGAPFDGQEMWRSTGKYVGGANPIQAYNDMTGGCSGGPWEIWDNGIPYTNGLNSFRYTNDPTTMYSPYFGNGFIALKDWATT